MSGLCRSIRAPCRAQRSKFGSRNGDLISIATTQDDGDDERAYDAQKVAYNCSWDDLDLESTFEHRSEGGPDGYARPSFKRIGGKLS